MVVPTASMPAPPHCLTAETERAEFAICNARYQNPWRLFRYPKNKPVQLSSIEIRALCKAWRRTLDDMDEESFRWNLKRTKDGGRHLDNRLSEALSVAQEELTGLTGGYLASLKKCHHSANGLMPGGPVILSFVVWPFTTVAPFPFRRRDRLCGAGPERV